MCPSVHCRTGSSGTLLFRVGQHLVVHCRTAAQEFDVNFLAVADAFTAAQAAQECGELSHERFLEFTAAQAAQESSAWPETRPLAFTAAQAAQECTLGAGRPQHPFTAAQVA